MTNLKSFLTRRPAVTRGAIIAGIVTLSVVAYLLWPVPVNVTVDGTTIRHFVRRGTVETALTRLAIERGPLDRVEPGPTTGISRNLTIRVVRVTERTVSEHETVTHDVIRRDSATLSAGSSERVQKGNDGSETVTYREVSEDGQVVRREVVDRVVSKPAVADIYLVGTGKSVTLSRGGVDYRSSRILTLTATAYDPSVGTTTATGTGVYKGIAAVDPRVIPLGTRLYIDGYGYALAADTGGAIKGNRIDLAFATKAEALQFGRRTVTVYVLQPQ